MISLIATVLNEGESIRRLMDSLAAQTRLPDEVVIVDGGSSDNTVEVIRDYETRLPLRVLVEAGCNISAGRNRAIREAQGDIIAVTDAGVALDTEWLEKIIQPLLDNPNYQVSGGFFHAETTTLFEAAMGATVLPLVNEIDPRTFLPSSRSVAFRKSAWEAVGGYPEWLDYCEDLVFDLRLKLAFSYQLPVTSHQLEGRSSRAGEDGAFAFVPEAVVDFRPRGSWSSYIKQYYRYARGDGKADLWRKRQGARYLTYLVAAPLIFAAGLLIHPLLWGLFLIGGAVYLRAPYRRLPVVARVYGQKRGRALGTGEWLYLAALIPVIRVVGDFAKMAGYPVGVLWRLRHHPPDWRTISG